MQNTVMIPRDKKFFSMRELKKLGLSRYKISKLADEGKLRKLNKTYFENTGYSGEESDLYYVKAFSAKGVICLMSAAVYYNLTNYIPEAVDVAIPRKARISTKPSRPLMNFYYFTDNRYNLGIMKKKEGKNEFQIYNIEKTIVDIIFYREKVGIEDTKEILTSYLKRKDRNLNRLLRYAKLMKCDKTIQNYLEVLL